MLPAFLWLRVLAMSIAAPLVYLIGRTFDDALAPLAGVLLVVIGNAIYVGLLGVMRPAAFRALHFGAVTAQTLTTAFAFGLGFALFGPPWREAPLAHAFGIAIVYVSLTALSDAIISRWLRSHPAMEARGT